MGGGARGGWRSCAWPAARHMQRQARVRQEQGMQQGVCAETVAACQVHGSGVPCTVPWHALHGTSTGLHQHTAVRPRHLLLFAHRV